MKAMGIVRKIDSLGRIVIPMEIRRLYNIKEGDPLEIYNSDDGAIILKKYNLTTDLLEEIELIETNIKEYVDLEKSNKAMKLIKELKEIIKNS